MVPPHLPLISLHPQPVFSFFLLAFLLTNREALRRNRQNVDYLLFHERVFDGRRADRDPNFYSMDDPVLIHFGCVQVLPRVLPS